MSSIDVNLDSVVTPASGSVTTSTTTPAITTGGQVSDTSSAAATAESNPLSVFHKLAQPVQLVDWSKIISEAIQSSKEQISSDEILNITSLKGMRLNAITTAEDLLALESRLYEIAASMDALYQQQLSSTNNANIAVNTYNVQTTQQTSSDQAQIDTMNAATAAYNASNKSAGPTATYNAAIAAYTSYASTTRVTAYSDSKIALNIYLGIYLTATAAQNATIDQINVQRAEAGIPLLPHISTTLPSIPAQPGMPAPPSPANSVTIPDATVPAPVAAIPTPTAPPSSADLIQQFAAPFLNSILASIQDNTSFYDKLTQFRDYERYYLGPLAGRVSTLPNSFTDQTSQVFLDQSVSVGSGAGVSLASMIAGLSDRSLNRVLSDSIANDAAQQAGIPLPPQLLDEIRLINLTLLSRAGLGSGIPAFSLLSERLAFIDKTSPSIPIAQSLAFFNQIAALTTSSDLKDAILSQLKGANSLADSTQLSQLAGTLAAASNVSFALFAVSQLSQSLKFPELTGQLLGLINTPTTASALQSASNTTVGDVLSNPSSLAHLKADLADALVSSGNFSQSAANDVAKGLIFNGVNSAEELSASVIKQLIDKGINASDATTLASRASDFTKSEIDGAGVLDTATQNTVVQRDSLAKELQQRGIDADTIAKVVPDIANEPYTSRRELRDGITSNLVASGSNLNEARKISTDIVRNGQSGVLTYPSVSDSQLAEAVTSRVVQQTSADLGARQSQQLADQLVSGLVGSDQTRPLSIANIIRTNTEALHAIDDAHLAQNMRDFLKPSFDLFQFNQRIMDPANNLVLSMWTGVMYSSPGKHTASVDILV